MWIKVILTKHFHDNRWKTRDALLITRSPVSLFGMMSIWREPAQRVCIVRGTAVVAELSDYS